MGTIPCWGIIGRIILNNNSYEVPYGGWGREPIKKRENITLIILFHH